MSQSGSFEVAWAAYQQASADLFVSSVGDTQERGGGGTNPVEDVGDRSQAVVARAEAVGDALSVAIKTTNLDQRELAALKLVAAAAYDLSLASDLLDAEQAGEGAEPERSAGGAVLASVELREILEAPLELGMTGLLEGEVERGGRPTDPVAARDQLEAAITEYIGHIPRETAALGQTAVLAVSSGGLDAVHTTALLAGKELLARVPGGLSVMVRSAASMVMQAIRKLWLAVVGNEPDDRLNEIQDRIKQLMADLRDKAMDLTLGWLYETERIRTEVDGLLQARTKRERLHTGTPDATPYNQATETLEGLRARYGKTKSTLEWTMRLLAIVKTPLLASLPWGPPAVYTAYIGVLGYAVYAGGDYLDWYRASEYPWLDRVEGLRTSVRKGLANAQET